MAKNKTTRPIHSNRGIEARFSKELSNICAEFEQSVFYWTKAAYNKAPPKAEKLMAQDASIVTELNKVFKELSKRWVSRFDDLAYAMAAKYMGETFKATDNAFMQSLIDAGWAIKPTYSAAVNEALKASISESVALIKSIPAQHLKNIEGLAMRSVINGRDLQAFTKELKEEYGSTTKRASLIARNQCGRATAAIRTTRALEAGLTEAVWMHSKGGVSPRKSHIEANGMVYNVAEGALIDGEYIRPGELINCRCSAKFILPR